LILGVSLLFVNFYKEFFLNKFLYFFKIFF
jgi:hypothetical protein